MRFKVGQKYYNKTSRALRVIEHMHTDGAVFSNANGESWMYCAVCKRPFRLIREKNADKG